MDVGTNEQKLAPECITAETRYLAYFWTGYFVQESFGIDFYFLTKEGRDTLRQFINTAKIKDINNLLFNPQVTQYFLENVVEGLWACPDKIIDAISHRLGREFPAKDELEKSVQSSDMVFAELQTLVRDALVNIREEEVGISLLSGYELARPPFAGIRFTKLYSVDMCYLDKIIMQDASIFEEHLKRIFNESCSKPEKYSLQLAKIYHNFCTSSIGTLRNGLFTVGTRDSETFLEWVMHQTPESERLFREKKAIPLVGNVEDLRACKLIDVNTYNTSSYGFEDNCLDFALIIGLDWLNGDWRRVVCEAERALKDRATIIVSGYHPNMFMLPKGGMYGGNLKGWKVYPITETLPLKRMLSEYGFEITEQTIPNAYWCIVGKRSH